MTVNTVISPSDIFHNSVLAATALLEELSGIKTERNGECLILTIAGQETDWLARLQGGGGPARSLWQFEKGGGVAELFGKTPNQLRAVCAYLLVPFDENSVFEAMAWNDVLGAAMCRLLLWQDPRPLPALGDVPGGWEYYLSNWRPGAPRPDAWPGNYAKAMTIV
jgi:hypothetical protein